MFALVPIFIGVIFLAVFSIIIFAIIKGIAQWSYNNGQPVLSVPATVVTKRLNTTGSGGMNNMNTVSTSYYVTFDLPDGGRQEFGMSGRNYGLLAEGDRGTLTYQGTRYKGFTRG